MWIANVLGQPVCGPPLASRRAKRTGYSVLAVVLLVIACVGHAQIRFQDVTATAGPFRSSESYGAAWGELNQDPWPDLFVSDHVMIPSALYLNGRDGRFSDVTASAGVAAIWSRAPRDTHGGIWADFDNDGDQDLLVLAGRCCEKQFLVNEGGVFIDRTVHYGFGGLVGGSGDFAGRTPFWFDYDRNGLLDVSFISLGTSALMKQTPSGFVDVTSAVGWGCAHSHYAQLVDLRNDRRMEVLCTYESTFPQKVYDVSTVPFSDITSVLPRVSMGLDSALADFNGDLRTDVFVVRGRLKPSQAKAFGGNRIEAFLTAPGEKGLVFQTSGIVTVDISPHVSELRSPARIFIGSRGVHPNAIPFSLDPSKAAVRGIASHNANVDFGIYVGYNPQSRQWQILHSPGGRTSLVYLFVRSSAPISGLLSRGLVAADLPVSPALLLSSAAGYRDQANLSGLGTPVSCVSAAAGDFDNDMDIDLYLVCRGGVENLPNRLYQNRLREQGVLSFVNVPAAGGAAGVAGMAVANGVGTGENVVVADYDVDGFLDLFVTNGLHQIPLRVGGPQQLFHNLGNGNHWVEFDLRGVSSDRDGIGAKVYVQARGVTQLREQNGGYHRWAQHHQRLHFGLAGNTQIDLLRVEWPRGATDEHRNIPANRLYRITEGGAVATVLP